MSLCDDSEACAYLICAGSWLIILDRRSTLKSSASVGGSSAASSKALSTASNFSKSSATAGGSEPSDSGDEAGLAAQLRALPKVAALGPRDAISITCSMYVILCYIDWVPGVDLWHTAEIPCGRIEQDQVRCTIASPLALPVQRDAAGTRGIPFCQANSRQRDLLRAWPLAGFPTR